MLPSTLILAIDAVDEIASVVLPTVHSSQPSVNFLGTLRDVGKTPSSPTEGVKSSPDNKPTTPSLGKKSIEKSVNSIEKSFPSVNNLIHAISVGILNPLNLNKNTVRNTAKVAPLSQKP